MNIEIGQILTPAPAWNKLEKHRKLPDKCEVLKVWKAPCQSGTMVLVNHVGHGQVELDLGWFEEYQNEIPQFDNWHYA